MGRHTFNPVRHRTAAVEKLLTARAGGNTLRGSAAVAGIDKATAYRWRLAAAILDVALRLAEEAARDRRRLARPVRPWVACHPSCPECECKVEVRSSAGSWCVRFWRCTGCSWKSWLPRHVRNCPTCRGFRLWSHSRKSVRCPKCRRRWTANPADLKPIPADLVTRPKALPVPTAAQLLARAVADLTPPSPEPEYMADEWKRYERLIG